MFDSSCNLKELNQDIEDENSLVITFDYESHQLLNKNNIKHEISDNYLNRLELETIQKKSYELVEWFKEEKPNELEYKGINVGSLMRVEFNYFLVPFLKNFVFQNTIFYPKWPFWALLACTVMIQKDLN